MANSRSIEINCDMGEGFGRWKMGPDEELMQHVDVTNVACGFHAGDPSIMVKTVRLAKQNNIRVGAHPGLPDLFGFGRRRIEVNPDDMYAMVLYQVGALAAILADEGVPLNHIKPHGELYFYLQRDKTIMDAVVRAVRMFDVPIYSLPTPDMVETCKRLGVRLIPELYVDIDYDAEENLVPVANSQHPTLDRIAKRIKEFASTDEVVSSAGSKVKLGFGLDSFSICIHSDLPGALDNAVAARAAVRQVMNA